MEMEMVKITENARTGSYDITQHALKRAYQRGFDPAMIPKVLELGEVISLGNGERQWVLPIYRQQTQTLPHLDEDALSVITIRDRGVEVVKTVYFVNWRLWSQGKCSQR